VHLSDISAPSDDVDFSPDGRLLLTVPRYGLPQIWNVSDSRNPSLASELRAAEDRVIFHAIFSPAGSLVAAADNNGSAVWDVSDLAHPTETHRLHGHQNAAMSIAFSLDGRTLMTGGEEGVTMLWSLNNREKSSALPLAEYRGGDQTVPEIVRFTPDGNTFVTGGDRLPIILWDVSDPRVPTGLASIGSPSDSTSRVEISSKADRLVQTRYLKPPTLWDISDLRHPARIGEVGSRPGDGVPSPDGSTLVRFGDDDPGGSNALELWDISHPNTPDLLASLTPSGQATLDARFSPSGGLLAVSSQDGVRLFDVSTLRSPKQISEIPARSGHIAFAPGHNVLAVDGPDTALSLWDISQPEVPKRLSEVPGQPGNEISFSSDGIVAATGTPASFAILWDISNPAGPAQIAQVVGHQGSVYNVAINPNGRTLATGSYDGSARLWAVPPIVADLADPVGVACALAGPGLSDHDWQQYLAASQIPQREIC
jgi:WD40 repeat protein